MRAANASTGQTSTACSSIVIGIGGSSVWRILHPATDDVFEHEDSPAAAAEHHPLESHRYLHTIPHSRCFGRTNFPTLPSFVKHLEHLPPSLSL
jgi:hypothetical protein